jgi:hypothetical protein
MQPDMNATCCKLYTIRLDTTLFQISKSQSKLLRRWEGFLAGEREGQGAGEIFDSPWPHWPPKPSFRKLCGVWPVVSTMPWTF